MNWKQVDFSQLPSPCYVIDCDILKNNLQIMKSHCDSVGIKPLISIKGFPLALLFHKMAPYINGLSAASYFEARLGKHLGKEIHIHAPAYRPDEISNVIKECNYVIFNSFSQWKQYQNIISQSSNRPNIGLRINLEYSEIEISKYNPCAAYSRFGITEENLKQQNITGINGFHLHTMYDNTAETFARIIDVLIDKFGLYLPHLSWINLGGGQRLADKDYHIELLHKKILRLKTEFGLNVYVEPCEAVITNCGYLVSTVLDVVKNKKQTAILDVSALCHMPDVLETPYCPDIEFPSSGEHNYIFAGASCMAGDIIGEYKLHAPINIGNKIVFSEMGAYTFAKESYFNVINLPAIVLYDQINGFQVVKEFNYKDYESRYF